MDSGLGAWVRALEGAGACEDHDVLSQDREGAFVSGPKTPDCPRVLDGELCEDFDDELPDPELSIEMEALVTEIVGCLFGEDQGLAKLKTIRAVSECAHSLKKFCDESARQSSVQRAQRGRRNRSRSRRTRSGKASHGAKAWGGRTFKKRAPWFF